MQAWIADPQRGPGSVPVANDGQRYLAWHWSLALGTYWRLWGQHRRLRLLSRQVGS
jgi:hypothetical protein